MTVTVQPASEHVSPGDAASVFSPGGAKPAAAGPDDDQDNDDDSLVVPSFGDPVRRNPAAISRLERG